MPEIAVGTYAGGPDVATLVYVRLRDADIHDGVVQLFLTPDEARGFARDLEQNAGDAEHHMPSDLR